MVEGVVDIELPVAKQRPEPFPAFHTSWGRVLAIVLDEKSRSGLEDGTDKGTAEINAYFLFPHNVLACQRVTAKFLSDWRQQETNPPIVYGKRKPYIPTGDIFSLLA